MGRQGLLLDRDGTIIADHGYVGSVDRVEFLDGAAEAIAAFNRAQIPIAVVSNQAGVARGFYSTDDVHKVHEYIAERLAEHGAHIDLFLFCPYHPEGTVRTYARRSADRKPDAGMALAAADALDLDLTSSWVVGDRPEDIGLAAAVGAHGVLLSADPATTAPEGIVTFRDLATAAPFILGQMDGRVSPPVRARKFPEAPFAQASAYCRAYFGEWSAASRSIDPAQLKQAADVLLDAYQRGAVVHACGNGGSAAIANHLQCDHSKGVRTSTSLRPRVVSLSSNLELLTAVANDISWDEVFTYQLESHARPGDVLVAISSSGRSANIVRALEWARDHELRTIALTGFDGGDSRLVADVAIHVDSSNYGVIEDTHQMIMHALAQYIRQSMMSPEAVAATTF